MKRQIWTLSMIVTVVVGACLLAGCAHCSKHHAQGETKVAKAEAENIALGKVPGGTVKEAELEKEDGKMVWSIEIASPGTTDVTEVEIDAETGAVLETEVEKADDDEDDDKDEDKDDDK